MDNNIRIGQISTINYQMGTARVVYKDKDNAVTQELPLFSYEYQMPEVDDLVLVVHLPNGKTVGVVAGRFWTDRNRPPEGFRGLYRKDLSRTNGRAMIRYDDNTGVLKIESPYAEVHTEELLLDTERMRGNGNGITFAGKDVAITASNKAEINAEGEMSLSSGNMTISVGGLSITASSITISGGKVSIKGSGDVVVDGVSLKEHTHTCGAPGEKTTKPN